MKNEIEEEKSSGGRYGPDSPTDKSLYPLPQKIVNQMISGLRKFDGWSYAPPEQLPKSPRIYQKQ